MGDVTKRRGRVLGMEPDEDGLQTIIAEVPLAELANFTTFIRQTTQGRGWFTTEFARYGSCPKCWCPPWWSRPRSWATWMRAPTTEPLSDRS